MKNLLLIVAALLTVSTGYASAGGGGGGGMPAKSKPLTGVNLVVSKTYNALDGINEALGDIAGQLSQIGSNTGVMKESLNGMSRELGSIGENVSFLMAIGGATALIALVVLCLVIGIRRKLSKSTDNIIQSYADQTAQPFQTTSPDQGPAADPANPLTPPTAPAPAGAPAAAPAADPAVMGPAVQIRNGVTALKNRVRTIHRERLDMIDYLSDTIKESEDAVELLRDDPMFSVNLASYSVGGKRKKKKKNKGTEEQAV